MKSLICCIYRRAQFFCLCKAGIFSRVRGKIYIMCPSPPFLHFFFHLTKYKNVSNSAHGTSHQSTRFKRMRCWASWFIIFITWKRKIDEDNEGTQILDRRKPVYLCSFTPVLCICLE
uniref:Uncharacterized protein n=1 Tax=Rhipicephalus zambeziensis TaxID=60191 RepID=A0A224YBP1_9ACAR